MTRNHRIAPVLLLAAVVAALPQAPASETFEVATIKPSAPDAQGRYLRMQDAHRLIARNETLEALMAAAYNLNPNALSGGPDWADSNPYDIDAAIPGETRPGDAPPSFERQMAMLRNLLQDRFHLQFHRTPKEMSVFLLTVAKGGARLTPAAHPEAPLAITSHVYPDKLELPARSATMDEFTAMLQRAVLDRPVLDQTGLTDRYNFDLQWTPDETQFGGAFADMSKATETAAPPLVAALEQQLGLKLQTGRGPVNTLVLDHAERPTAN